MDLVKIPNHLKGCLSVEIILLTILQSIFSKVVAQKAPSFGMFDPIEISPSVLPQYPFAGETWPPMYPSLPKTYNPILTGRCPFNFSSISSIMEKTASDCSQILAPFVGNVICCPQFDSLMHIFRGYYSKSSNSLGLQNTTADDCFLDMVEILKSKGANSSIPSICSVKPSNLTGGSCPVKDVNALEKVTNTSKLLEACSVVDPLKECCRAVCQPAIAEAAFHLSLSSESTVDKNSDALDDCKGVIYSWISRKLPSEASNSAFRRLASCKVNKVCPLELDQPVEVIKACHNVSASNHSCCSSLHSYISGMQKDNLITNKQAIICASVFSYMLQKGGVHTDIYELCNVDLKDFSHQGIDQEACLLRSWPTDIVYDNSSGVSFTCDLSDNIPAPWPSPSSMTSFSLCAPEMSLPAFPTSESGYFGCNGILLDLLVTIVGMFILGQMSEW